MLFDLVSNIKMDITTFEIESFDKRAGIKTGLMATSTDLINYLGGSRLGKDFIIPGEKKKPLIGW